jgi:hypothetical protein
MRKLILFSVILIQLLGCNTGSQRDLDVDTSDINIPQVEIRRYEKALFTIVPDSLQSQLKTIAPDYPAFLGADLDDTLHIIQLNRFVSNSLNRMLYDSVMATYPKLGFLEDQLTEAFRYFKYYFPTKPVPDVFTYVSGLLYEMPVQFFSDDMIVALDMYLGALDEYRKMRIPLYKIQNMNREYIVRDAMYELYYYHFLEKPGKDFLQMMINRGKHLYFLDAMMPQTPDHIKIAYRPEKLAWCQANEKNIWAFVIENELLYSSNTQITRKFFTDGPFTSEFSADSPARLGEWLGWQIVRAYMERNPQIGLEELIQKKTAQEILKNAAYKPAA